MARPEDARYSEIEGSRPRSLGLEAEFDLAPGQRLQAGIADGHERRWYDDVSPARVAYANRYDISRRQAHVGWQGEMDGWRAQLRAYRSEMGVRNSRTGGVAPTRDQDMRDQVLDGHASSRLGGHQLTLGGEWRNEALANAGLAGGRDDVTHKALFAQDEFALGQSLLATLGLRADHHGLFGSELSPRAYLVWEASPRLVVKGGYGHAFKAPTLKQISPHYVGAEGPHSFPGQRGAQARDVQLAGAGRRLAAGEHLGRCAPRRSTPRCASSSLTACCARSGRAAPTSTTTWTLRTSRAWSWAPPGRSRRSCAGAWTRRAAAHARPEHPRPAPVRPAGHQRQLAPGLAGARLGRAAGPAIHRQPDQQRRAPARLPPVERQRGPRLARGCRPAPGPARRAGEPFGNVRLAEKSPAFGYAEQGRRVFASARLEF